MEFCQKICLFPNLDNLSINYLEENTPLGTAGALSLMQNKFVKPIFVTNCDVIVMADYSKILDFHKEGNFKITIVSAMQHHKIPYGVCSVSPDGVLLEISEKPNYDYLVNTGLYIIEPSVIDLVPKSTVFDFPDLIKTVLLSGEQVGVFPITQNEWVDIGELQLYFEKITNGI